jgi:hypothetical protein
MTAPWNPPRAHTTRASVNQNDNAGISKNRESLKITNGHPWIHPLFGALLGVCFFVAIYGVSIVAPKNINWLLHGDPAQHYLGFAFFRNSPWQWPLGAISQFGLPTGTTIVFTDSIPILALIFKPFTAWLPTNFQYFGAWMLFCHAAYGALAIRILLRLHLSAPAAAVGTLLLLTSPAMALRAYGHESLMAHWLLLASIDTHLAQRPTRHWVLIVLASLIHAYWVPMLAPLALYDFFKTRTPWQNHLRGTIALLVAMSCAGYFSAKPQLLSAEGYGNYSANLLTLFDPMDWAAFLRHYGRSVEGIGEWSRLLPPLGQARPGQYEGFAYLGAGVIFLLTLAIGVLIFNWFPTNKHLQHASPNLRVVTLIAILMAIFSLSLHVTMGHVTIVMVTPARWLDPWLGVFRSTGRFVWLLATIIPILVLKIITRRAKEPEFFFLLICTFFIQCFDLSSKWSEYAIRFSPGNLVKMPDYSAPAWEKAKCFNRLIVLPAQPNEDNWIAPAFFAASNRQSINIAHISRADDSIIRAAEAEEIRTLQKAMPRADSAYLIRDPEIISKLPQALDQVANRWPIPDGTIILPHNYFCPNSRN